MNIYRIETVKHPARAISGREFIPDNGCCAIIGSYPWDGGYTPDARAYVTKNDIGLNVTMCANEKTIAANETRFGGAVCVDSCLEFFLNPCPKSGDLYVNIEVSAAGVAHIGVGAARENRFVLTEPPDMFNVSHSKHCGAWWAVSYTLSWNEIARLAGHKAEEEMRGNFYTCDESAHPHFGVWNYVKSDAPDFHRPECFGILRQ